MRLIRFHAFLLAIITGLFIITASQTALAQTGENANADWQTIRPDGEEFAISMPKDPKTESSKEPYHKMELNTNLYLSATEHGPVFAVVSLSGIKSNPALYSEFERLNSYVDAFKNWFPPKVRKGAVAKLTLVGGKTLNGNAGREYRLVLGDLSGTAHVYTTRKRFYAVVVLNTKKDDALTEQFLSSFYLPEKGAPPAAIAADAGAQPTLQVTPGTPDGRAARKEPGNDTSTADAAATSDAPGGARPVDAASAPNTQPGQRAPISGGVLNGKAQYLPKPDYPPEARAAGAAGAVVVQVTIDEAGSVINAKAISGHPMLQQACVNAALQARFSPTSLMGEPVKVTGVIMYNFAR